MKKLIIFILISFLSVLLISCGEEESESPPTEWGGVQIWYPTADSIYTTDSGSIILMGSAPISKEYYRCCSGNPTDTGITVRWENKTTGTSGNAEQGVEYCWFFSTPYVCNHTWSATIPIDMGYNNIRIRASDPKGIVGGDGINVIRGPITVTGVTVKSSTTLLIGATEQLTATIIPANAANQNVNWSSSNANIVTVNNDGLITGIAEGAASVMVITEDGNFSAICTVSVSKPVAVTGVTIRSSTTMYIGETEQFTATINPANSTNRNMTWDSTNTDIVTVTSNGLVTAIALGTAAIKVTTEDGGYSAQCDITVSNNMFITTWSSLLTESGTTASNQIKLPLYSGGTYDFYVKWGDGNTDHITSYNQAETTHTYSSGGIYDVAIYGTIEGFGFSSTGIQDSIKLLDVKKWSNVKLHNNGYQFYMTRNLSGFSAPDVPVLSHITNMSGMFYNAYRFNQNIGSWNVSGITNMSYLFYGARSFNGNIGSWNVSNVTDMSYMFYNASSFNQDLNSWNVSNITNMDSLFNGASSFNQDLNSWNVSNVITMGYMFYNATSFNGNIDLWNVSSVMSMRLMFIGASSFNQNLDSWDVGSDTIILFMFIGSPMEGHEPIWWHP